MCGIMIIKKLVQLEGKHAALLDWRNEVHALEFSDTEEVMYVVA